MRDRVELSVFAGRGKRQCGAGAASCKLGIGCVGPGPSESRRSKGTGRSDRPGSGSASAGCRHDDRIDRGSLHHRFWVRRWTESEVHDLRREASATSDVRSRIRQVFKRKRAPSGALFCFRGWRYRRPIVPTLQQWALPFGSPTVSVKTSSSCTTPFCGA